MTVMNSAQRCYELRHSHNDTGAVAYAIYIRNYLPTRANADHASPIETPSRKRPSVSHIIKFGSKCTRHFAHPTKQSAK
ncbi:LOW QUALITY PROTEIN: hypothetical protein PHMEG_0007116 [Phytophthora megakarya]|uniref:Uncharacterized protein n=1 Tax=Phytophthora megakarya TaxID=4795 RepID=A0A225WNS7_9STRA|nr:LOW QUALITY PROTEIN: hypothetical protein PHMEG_0007116 [Phytophthora megakarya]